MFQRTIAIDPAARSQTLHAFSATGIDGRPKDLSAWRGRVVLVVNTASECGFTDQYSGLQELQQRFGQLGFDVLGFPSNDFGGQEPGNATQIEQFCTLRYQVTFPLFDKVGVKAGTTQSRLYGWLGGRTGKLPGWNFCKYLIGRDGHPIAFWSSETKPDDAELVGAIEQALKQEV